MTLQRTESFVPLTAAPAPPARREFNVTVVHSEVAAPNFQSLSTPPSAPHKPATTGEKKSCEPRVSVQRDGNRVTHLRVQCSCGEVIDLACLYDESANPPA
jgi:hypothetical protein